MKKNYIVLVVYNRLHNLQKWLHCWNVSEHHDFELVVVHNTDSEQPKFREECEYYGVQYIQRPNVGFDLAPFQDICLERLDGFNNDWDKLILVADDWFPMTKNFIKQYVNHYEHGVVGVVCTEVSDLIKTHIRTSAFLIPKDVSKRLRFDVDKITTKDDCYAFEHKSPNALYEQIINMGLKIELVSPLHIAPIWDSEHRAYLNRMAEHNEVFYSTKKVVVLCPIYKSFPQIVSSMINQSHKIWELHLIHDGEADSFISDYLKVINDDRIKYIVTENRVGNYGHPIRQEYLNKLRTSDADYVLITNGDNYHTPNCLEALVKGFDSNTIATYCDKMIHSYVQWQTIDCKLELGYLDCACVMVRKDVACKVGWNDVNAPASDWVYFEDIAKAYGWSGFKKVNGCLLIHN